jgi:hypothetical protein
VLLLSKTSGDVDLIVEKPISDQGSDLEVVNLEFKRSIEICREP